MLEKKIIRKTHLKHILFHEAAHILRGDIPLVSGIKALHQFRVFRYIFFTSLLAVPFAQLIFLINFWIKKYITYEYAQHRYLWDESLHKVAVWGTIAAVYIFLFLFANILFRRREYFADAEAYVLSGRRLEYINTLKLICSPRAIAAKSGFAIAGTEKREAKLFRDIIGYLFASHPRLKSRRRAILYGRYFSTKGTFPRLNVWEIILWGLFGSFFIPFLFFGIASEFRLGVTTTQFLMMNVTQMGFVIMPIVVKFRHLDQSQLDVTIRGIVKFGFGMEVNKHLRWHIRKLILFSIVACSPLYLFSLLGLLREIGRSATVIGTIYFLGSSMVIMPWTITALLFFLLSSICSSSSSEDDVY